MLGEVENAEENVRDGESQARGLKGLLVWTNTGEGVEQLGVGVEKEGKPSTFYSELASI